MRGGAPGLTHKSPMVYSEATLPVCIRTTFNFKREAAERYRIKGPV